jgi:hypothetical protein
MVIIITETVQILRLTPSVGFTTKSDILNKILDKIVIA